MGEVYRARDTRLDRTVAIKVLPAAFASNAQLRSRFEREAKVISSLSHPHICTLHDIGSSDGVDFLVMEHLEGETLFERLARGQMSLDDVYRYAIQIAEALERAHRVGVIHRDLKPANVMITKAGAKLLDFGLAKVTQSGTTDVTAALEAPTEKKSALTSEGAILGTYQYMSPEQLEGHEADQRSDIFAFGAVLYEMLTGRRAFDGKSRASIIGAILAAEPPPVATLRAVTPAGLDRLVRLCLLKDPEERWQSVHDLKLELEALRAQGDVDAPTTASRRRNLLPWAAALFFAALAVATWGWYSRRPAIGQERAIRALLSTPGAEFNPADGPATISPDGTKVVVRMRKAGGTREYLAVRDLDGAEFVPLQGTDGAIDPFWSPDSQQIAFFTERKIRRMPAGGGPLTVVCDSGPDPRGAAWAGDTILFSPAPNKPILRVKASGGKPVPALKLDQARSETGQWRPQFLPDGEHFVYLSQSAVAENTGVFVADVNGTTPPRMLIDASTTAIFAPPGFLLYVYSGDLYAQPLDMGKLEKSGTPVLLAKNVEYSQRFGSTGYSVSNDGTLIFHTFSNESRSKIVAVAPDGGEIIQDFDGTNLDLSPDEGRIALQRLDASTRTSDIWIQDLKRGTRTRLTFDGVPDIGPVWSPDGTQVVYVSQSPGVAVVNVRPSSGAGEVREIMRSTMPLEITDWSRDGRYLVAEVFADDAGGNICLIDLAGDRKLQPIVATRLNEDSPRLSSDGRFILYMANESGQNEIYVRRFPVTDERWQVSSGGGASARWSADGKSLLYVRPDRRIAKVPIDTHAGFQLGEPTLLASTGSVDITRPTANGVIYTTRDQSPADTVTILTNWHALVKR